MRAMRHCGLAVGLMLCCLNMIAIPHAEAKPESMHSNVLIVLASQEIAPMWLAIKKIETYGGRVDHVFPPNTLIGYLPSHAAAALASYPLIVSIDQGLVAVTDKAQHGESARLAAEVWNINHMGLSPPFATSPAKGLLQEPLNDALIAPDWPGSAALVPRAPSSFQTSEFMIGRVAVGIITPESNGAIDPSAENWSATRQTQVVVEIQAGLQWWKDNVNAPSNLTFVYDIHHGVATSYEPIARSAFPAASGEGLWISEVMANLGYAGSDYFTKVRNYVNAIRQTYGTNWAYAIFVVDSLNDANGQFVDGYFAYAYLNGPFVVMTYDNNGWGIDRMDMVTAHETGHTFGALDEYASSSCTDTERFGYLDIANTNCENGDPPTEDSIMRSASSQDIAWPNHLVSTPARQMVGWRDSDGDGKELYDPVDTTPTVTLTPYSPDPTTDTTPTYSGSAQDTPYPSPTHTPTTINAVRVEWRVDGGSWQAAQATDGAFDSDAENFTFTPPSFLSAGTHLFEARTINSVGNISTLAQDTLTITVTSSFTLTVSVRGSANGTVTGSGISCATGSTCITSYASGTPVTLTEAPGSGASFKQWGGACSGTATTCVVTMSTNQSVTATFSQLFTDPTLTAGSTPIKAVHVTELRSAINTLRAVNNLAAFSWTDPTLTAGTTPAKKVHMDELRQALNEAYQAAGQSAPGYTDPTIVAQQTMIKASHVSELRTAVRALE